MGSIWYQFRWPDAMVVVPQKWFSFCIVFNQVSLTVTMSVNGIEVFNKIDKKYQVKVTQSSSLTMVVA
jgi:hypothetical protein